MANLQEPTVPSTRSRSPGGIIDEEYTAEKIIDRLYNISQKKYFYRVIWRRLQDGDERDSWEPEDYLVDCENLISEYEKELDSDAVQSDSEYDAEADDGVPNVPNVPITITNQPIGFARGLEADRILGVTGCAGEVHFLIKWKGSDIVDIVPSAEANVNCPQVVISFYENRIQWIQNRTFEELLGLEPEPDPEEIGVSED